MEFPIHIYNLIILQALQKYVKLDASTLPLMPSSHRPWGEVRTTFLHSVCFQMSPQNVPHAVHITECCCCRSREGCFRSHKPVKIIFLSLLILTEYDNGNDDDYHYDDILMLGTFLRVVDSAVLSIIMVILTSG